jgi:hypothetical protein
MGLPRRLTPFTYSKSRERESLDGAFCFVGFAGWNSVRSKRASLPLLSPTGRDGADVVVLVTVHAFVRRGERNLALPGLFITTTDVVLVLTLFFICC